MQIWLESNLLLNYAFGHRSFKMRLRRSSNVATRLFIGLCFVVTLLVQHPDTASAAERCFVETGFCISGRIQEYWEQNGGLPVFGLPIGSLGVMTVDGQKVIAQRFERNRLELHPTNNRPYDVLLGRLGANRLDQTQRDWNTFPKASATPGCRYFSETQQNVCTDFLRYWQSHGLQIDGKARVTEAESIALFGLPLSGVQTETMADGNQYQVQWFERARFEFHPENPVPYRVLLGLLGNEVAVNAAGASAAVPTVSIPVARVPSTEELAAFSYRMPVGGYWRSENKGIIVEVRNFVYFKNPNSLSRTPTQFLECQIAVINDPQRSGYNMNITDMAFMIVDSKGVSNGVNQKWLVEETGIPHRTQGRYVFLMTKNAAPATLIANFSGIPLDINLQTWPIPD
jgi:hypothetical protein